MNHTLRVQPRPRRAWPPAARTATALIATAALILLAAACGGSPASTDSGGSSDAGGSGNSSLLAFSQCMRSRGVPDFPDPQPGASNAKFPSAQQLGVSSSQYDRAQNDCQHLLPASASHQFPPAEVQQLLTGMREYSQCMRSHGVANWPDPSLDAQGQPYFDISSHGITRTVRRSPQVATPMAECHYLLPSALGQANPPLG